MTKNSTILDCKIIMNIGDIPTDIIGIIISLLTIDDSISFLRVNSIFNNMLQNGYGKELIITKFGITKTPQSLTDIQIVNLYNILTHNISGSLYLQGSSFYMNSSLPNFQNFTKIYDNVKGSEFGRQVMFILFIDGTVYGIGMNRNIILGIGNTNYVSDFTKIDVENVKQISVGETFTLFLNNKGEVFRCGSNEYGQLGYTGNKKNRRKMIRSPEKIKELSNIKFISAGRDHSLFLDYDGNVYSCGSYSNGKLGRDMNYAGCTFKIGKVNVSNIMKVRATDNNSLFLTKDGEVFFCGRGENYPERSPKLITNLPPIYDIKGSIYCDPFGIIEPTCCSPLLSCSGEVYLFASGNIHKIIGLSGVIDFVPKSYNIFIILLYDGTIYEYCIATGKCTQLNDYPKNIVKLEGFLSENIRFNHISNN